MSTELIILRLIIMIVQNVAHLVFVIFSLLNLRFESLFKFSPTCLSLIGLAGGAV